MSIFLPFLAKVCRTLLYIDTHELIEFFFVKKKNNVRRFDPDKVENGHIYSSIKEQEVFIYWAYLTFSVGYAEDFVGRFDNH